MKNELKKVLLSQQNFYKEGAVFDYSESINEDALSEDWLKNRTSYIYKVGVLTAIDSNKCDWVYVVIGSQRHPKSPVQIIGILHFESGENDDIRSVIDRAVDLLNYSHPVFEK